MVFKWFIWNSLSGLNLEWMLKETTKCVNTSRITLTDSKGTVEKPQRLSSPVPFVASK